MRHASFGFRQATEADFEYVLDLSIRTMRAHLERLGRFDPDRRRARMRRHFEAGSLHSPIWSGCWWADDQRPEPSGPQQRLIATSAGHQVLIDEEADEISLVHPGGATLVLGKDSVTLSIGEAKIEMASGEVKINGTVAKFTAAGASLVDDAFKVGG